MIFNKASKGAEELQKLTGNYYASNKFDKIETEIMLESEKISDLIGIAVFAKAEAHYLGSTYKLSAAPDGETEEQLAVRILNDKLVQHIQLPVAMMATHHFYQANIISHEDAGRKVKIDSANEKLPWEWMLDRDDQANLRKAYVTIDRLLRFLDDSEISEWMESDARAASKELFVADTATFQEVFPIDNSPRFFYTIVPFLKEVQRLKIKKALGTEKYEDLLTYVKRDTSQDSESSPSTDDELEELLTLIRQAMPLLAMVTAVKRLAIQVLPEGVVQQFKSLNTSVNASQPVLADLITLFTRQLQEDGDKALDEVMKFLRTEALDLDDYPLIPLNPTTNKIFRT